MQDAYRDDLSDFIRNGALDGYELTDDELAHFLEVWRWSVWTRRNRPNGPEHDLIDATQHLRAHMVQVHNVDIDYNTLLLLRQELEPMMYYRVLANLPHVLGYFLVPWNWLKLFRAWRYARRYRRLVPVHERRSNTVGYPKAALERLPERPPDLVQRKYWHRVAEQDAERWW